MSSKKIHDVAYCLNCNKYFDEDLKDGQGFVCCPECKKAYRFNVIQLTYDDNEGYGIELQDEFVITFRDKREFNKLFRVMEKLIDYSKINKREVEYYEKR